MVKTLRPPVGEYTLESESEGVGDKGTEGEVHWEVLIAEGLSLLLLLLLCR